MSIRHQVQNQLIEKFLLESKKTKIPIVILFAGDFWTTVEIHSMTIEDEANAFTFINTFDEINN